MGALELVHNFPTTNVAGAIVSRSRDPEVIGDLDKEFAIASVTKLLVAYSALVAIEENTIGIDDQAGPPGSTVAHLLAHASGLGPDQSSGQLAEPGAKRIYSNAGFEALAAHIQSRADIVFASYLEMAVLGPLSMSATHLDGSPASGARSTLRDLVCFVDELFSPGLIDGSTLARATEVAFPGLSGVLPGFGRQDPCDWGLGFELRGEKSPHWTGARNSRETFGHFGQSGVFVWLDPAIEVGLVVLSDEAFGTWAMQQWPSLSDAVVAERSAS